ncbi:MAG: sigma factor-like helix-turn-helix DNA-binding protein, partial [Gemmataceae bacterium]
RKIADNWRRLRKQEAGEAASLDLASAHPDDDPARVAELRDSLGKFLDRVNAAERRLLELYLLGWSSAEIAAELKSTDHVVRARMSKLRAKLAEQGGPDWI